MAAQELNAIARSIVADHKGILAADESHGHDQEALRLDRRRVDRGEPPRLPRAAVHHAGLRGLHRRRHPLRRDDPPGADDGTPFAELLAAKGIDPGHQGRQGRAGRSPVYPGETVTEGLDGLRERLAEYRELGARFAKWRAVITIGDGIPTDACIHANAHALARYAALCQEAGIVPIVEPEVLMDGDHTIERCYEVTVAHAARSSSRSSTASASRSRACCSSRTW